jgi:hypothetical protein
MLEVIINNCKTIKNEIDKLTSQYDTKLSELHKQFIEIATPFSDFEIGWAGEWMNENFNQYYEDFKPNSDYGLFLNMNDFRDIIEQRTGISPNGLINELKPITKYYTTFKEFVITELSILSEVEKFEKEADILKEVEKFSFGFSSKKWIENRRPKQLYVRDMRYVNKGVFNVPPHIALEAEILSSMSEINAIGDLVTLINRIIRQVEIKYQIDGNASTDQEELQNRLSNLFEKFHIVAKQLRNRYNSRSTIVIEDEYDVQDLVHALLRVDFKDVRPEEYAPSYAGGASRVDFLLKDERTIIEIKKTRSGLKDKEIGNQLILDIAKYRSHPDCSRLVCFVYDPEGLIMNPRGLENDLQKNSSDELLVEVYIRP